jgi:hypothetical protein
MENFQGHSSSLWHTWKTLLLTPATFLELAVTGGTRNNCRQRNLSEYYVGHSWLRSEPKQYISVFVPDEGSRGGSRNTVNITSVSDIEQRANNCHKHDKTPTKCTIYYNIHCWDHTLLRVSTLLGHHQGDNWLYVNKQLWRQVQWTCAVDFEWLHIQV